MPVREPTIIVVQFDPTHVVTILGMAVITLILRTIGYWFVRRHPLTGRLAAALDAVPVAVLTAVVTPMALTTGIAESLAALLTILAAWRLPALVAIALGVIGVVGLRSLF